MHMSRWSFFNKNVTREVRGPMALLCVVLLIGACGDQQGVVGHETSNEEVSVGIALSKVAVSVVARAELVVTAPDIDAITAPLDIVDDRLVGSVVVPTGSGRLFTINAYDAGGALIYTGQARADVVPGSGTDLPRIAVGRVEASSDLPPVVLKTAPNGEEMQFLLVSRGSFSMGKGESGNNAPEHVVYSDDFYIGEYEVTNTEFVGFLQQVGNKPEEVKLTTEDGTIRDYEAKPVELSAQRAITEIDGVFAISDLARANHPIMFVSWHAANAFCTLIGARLPTEAEWEKAARGKDGWRYPWGDRYEEGYARINQRGLRTGPDDDHQLYTAPVGSLMQDRSPYGAYDMAGNAAEWCADNFSPSYYLESPVNNPRGPTYTILVSHTPTKVVRGGHYQEQDIRKATGYFRNYQPIAQSEDHIGFRCACDPD